MKEGQEKGGLPAQTFYPGREKRGEGKLRPAPQRGRPTAALPGTLRSKREDGPFVPLKKKKKKKKALTGGRLATLGVKKREARKSASPSQKFPRGKKKKGEKKKEKKPIRTQNTPVATFHWCLKGERNGGKTIEPRIAHSVRKRGRGKKRKDSLNRHHRKCLFIRFWPEERKGGSPQFCAKKKKRKKREDELSRESAKKSALYHDREKNGGKGGGNHHNTSQRGREKKKKKRERDI